MVGNRLVTEPVEANAALPIGLPCQPLATLSIAGWAGGGPPFVYVNHEGTVAAPVLESYNADAQVCHLHEQHRSTGQSNYPVKGWDGTGIFMQERRNGVGNCLDATLTWWPHWVVQPVHPLAPGEDLLP